jgi:hypothetical protein
MSDHSQVTEPLRVTRWRKFGHDRLYVSTGDDVRVGWVNLLTGERTLELEEHREAFDRALADHPDAPAAPVVAEPDSALRTVEAPSANSPEASTIEPATPEHEPWSVRIDHTDLAVRQAGQAAREQAVAYREAAPIKTFVGRVLGVRNDERAWRIGAKGEEKVAARLDRLPEGWHVLHAVPVGSRGADIDHVVMGPAGVFTVNAKHHPDAKVWVGGNTVMVNGHRQPYVRNSRHEAQRAARLLSAAVDFDVPVMGVIAVVGAHKGFTVKSQPDDVHVTTRKQLARWLEHRRSVLSETQVTAVYTAARKSTTWK